MSSFLHPFDPPRQPRTIVRRVDSGPIIGIVPPDGFVAETFDPDAAAVMFFADMTLLQASRYMDDGETYFETTQPLLMSRFPGITLSEYWGMTVADHRRFVAALEQQAVADGE